MDELCVVVAKLECTLEKFREVLGHCRDKEPAECAQNSQYPALD